MKARENAPNGSTVELTLSPGDSFGDFRWPGTAASTTVLVVRRTVNPLSPPDLVPAQEADIAALEAAIADGLVIEPYADPATGLTLSVSSAQAMIQLSRMRYTGQIAPEAKNMAEATEALIARSSDYELKTWFARAQRWLLDNPNVAKIAKVFQLTDGELRAAFLAASKIEE